MKIVYFLRNPGIASRTPPGWTSAVVAPRPDGSYSDEHLREMPDADIFVVGLEPVPEEVFAKAGRLKLVQRLGVGYNNIDLAAAARRGVPVCNLPDFNSGTVAEHTLMLILALLRRVFESTLLMKGGQWPLPTVVAAGIHDLQGKGVGIVGLGAIGRAVARRALAFDARVTFYDSRGTAAANDIAGVRFLRLHDLLGESDVVTLHLPLTSENRGLLGREQLGLMKPSAILVNTARGALVDELALADALREGRIAGAGIDVFAEEPLPPQHPLRRCPNLLLTPHTAGQTREAMERMIAIALENIERVARGEEPRYRVDRDAPEGRQAS